MHVKRQRTLSSGFCFFFLQVNYFFLEQNIYIQLGEERFLEALNIVFLPNASLLLKIHQDSSDAVGSVLRGFLGMLYISVSRAIADPSIQLNICHKQSVNTEKRLWNTITLRIRLLSAAPTVLRNRFVFFRLGFAICDRVLQGGGPFFPFKTHWSSGYQEHKCCRKDIRSTVSYYITGDLASVRSISLH